MLRLAVTLLLLLVLAAPAQAAVPRGWTPTASMGVARYLHTATLLDNGKVLVTGGLDGTAVTNTTELFDPATGTWSPAAPMHFRRHGHAAVKRRDGTVLVVGGAERPDGGTLRTAEVYDPSTNGWTTVGDMQQARYQASPLLLLTDDSAVVAGGSDVSGYHANAERFGGGAWQTITNPFAPTGRNHPRATVLDNGVALVAGGWDGSNALAEASRLSGNAWTRTSGDLIDGRWMFDLTRLPGNRALATGGHTANAMATTKAEIYNFTTDRFDATTPMLGAHSRHTATALPNGKVLVAGGLDTVRETPFTELFDPVSLTWAPAGNLTVPRQRHTTTLLADGRVLLAGGQLTETAELWTPTTALTHDPSLTLGDQPSGTTGTGSFAVTNTADFPLFADEFTIGGTDAADFAVDGRACRGPVAPQAACVVHVSFRPGATAVRRATLTFSANTAAGTHTVPLSGRGVPATTDGDGDRVLDGVDRCRRVKGPASRRGCPTGLLADPSIRYTRSGKGIRVLAYYVKATTGARVIVKCSKGCRQTVTRGRGSRRVRITRLNGKRLAHGAKITITVSKPGRLTTTVTDRVSRGRRIEGRARCAPVACYG